MIVGDCLQGSLESKNQVQVLGDSHGAMLNHLFDYLGNELDFKAKVITASSCVTIPGFDYQRLPGWAQKPCSSQISEAENFIAKADVIFLAGSWSYQFTSKEFNRIFRSFLENLSKDGKEVFLFPQIPVFDQSPIRLMRFQHVGLPLISNFSDSSAEIINAKLVEIAKIYPNVEYLNLNMDKLFENAPFYKDDLIY